MYGKLPYKGNFSPSTMLYVLADVTAKGRDKLPDLAPLALKAVKRALLESSAPALPECSVVA